MKEVQLDSSSFQNKAPFFLMSVLRSVCFQTAAAYLFIYFLYNSLKESGCELDMVSVLVSFSTYCENIRRKKLLFFLQ